VRAQSPPPGLNGVNLTESYLSWNGMLNLQLFLISVNDSVYEKTKTFLTLLMVKACVVCRDDNNGRTKEKCYTEPLFKSVFHIF